MASSVSKTHIRKPQPSPVGAFSFPPNSGSPPSPQKSTSGLDWDIAIRLQRGEVSFLGVSEASTFNSLATFTKGSSPEGVLFKRIYKKFDGTIDSTRNIAVAGVDNPHGCFFSGPIWKNFHHITCNKSLLCVHTTEVR